MMMMMMFCVHAQRNG